MATYGIGIIMTYAVGKSIFFFRYWIYHNFTLKVLPTLVFTRRSLQKLQLTFFFFFSGLSFLNSKWNRCLRSECIVSIKPYKSFFLSTIWWVSNSTERTNKGKFQVPNSVWRSKTLYAAASPLKKDKNLAKSGKSAWFRATLSDCQTTYNLNKIEEFRKACL